MSLLKIIKDAASFNLQNEHFRLHYRLQYARKTANLTITLLPIGVQKPQFCMVTEKLATTIYFINPHQVYIIYSFGKHTSTLKFELQAK